MQLSLSKKWKFDDESRHIQGISSRLYPGVYGCIVGDAVGSLYVGKSRGTFHVLDINETTKCSEISIRLFNLIQAITAANDGRAMIKEYDQIDLITYISPLVFIFADRFDFNKLLITLEEYANVTHDNNCSKLGCLLYLCILLRLYHYGDFESALDSTMELCKEHLHGTVYEQEMKYYDRILSKEIKDLPESEIFSDSNIVHLLEAALWCCMNNSSFKDTILAAVNLGGNTAEIAALAGTMAGMFFKEDVSGLLPKTNYDYDSLLVKFRDFCAERKN